MSTRSFMRADLAPAIARPGPGIRGFEPQDVAVLGPLMHRAYRGTVDDGGESPEQAAEEIARTVAGAYGTFLPAASIVLSRGGALRCATLVTRFQDQPFVAFTFTDPDFKGQGLARACMQAAMDALAAQGERTLRLVVTLANAPAVHLYRGLGFRFEDG